MKSRICEKKTYTVSDIMEVLGIGRNAAYKLVNSNQFRIIRVGRSIRISKESFDEWLNKNG